MTNIFDEDQKKDEQQTILFFERAKKLTTPSNSQIELCNLIGDITNYYQLSATKYRPSLKKLWNYLSECISTQTISSEKIQNIEDTIYK